VSVSIESKSPTLRDADAKPHREVATARERSRGRGLGAAPVPIWLKRLLGPVILLGVWFLISGLGLVSEQQLPAPATVFGKFIDLIEDGSLQENLTISLRRAMEGLALGVAAGVACALLSGLSKLGEYVIDAPMQMLRSMPILALVPLAIVWFGIGEEVKVILVALGVAFPIYLNTHAGIRGVDPRFIELARSVGLSRWQLIRRVVLPGALPNFFTGLRFAVSIAWLVLVVSEQINAESGIGFLMTQARNLGQTEIIVVGLLVYAFLGLISDTLVRLLERRALRWRPTLQG
jgi:sulfonate transport system permease protein